MASISVCMIVKNEQEVLARCLDSLQGLWDELIIVDTGSQDATKEIARKYTDKVYDFEWVDDFAAARNFSLSKAGCDYIYVADADEVLTEENRQRFAQLKQAILPEIEVVEMGYADQLEFSTTSNFTLDYRPKLFRRLRSFVYIDPIHEVLRTDPLVFRSNIVVDHRPTSLHAGRDLALLEKTASRQQGLSSRLEMMYARELLIAGTAQDFKKAQPYFESVRTNPEKPGEAIRRAACVLAVYAAMQQDSYQLLKVAGPELVGQPPAEICCALGNFYLAGGDAAQAADWFGAALSGAVPELAAAYAGAIPLEGIASCFEAAGDLHQADEYRAKAAQWRKDNQ